jgi:hypothetical protein
MCNFTIQVNDQARRVTCRLPDSAGIAETIFKSDDDAFTWLNEHEVTDVDLREDVFNVVAQVIDRKYTCPLDCGCVGAHALMIDPRMLPYDHPMVVRANGGRRNDADTYTRQT